MAYSKKMIGVLIILFFGGLYQSSLACKRKQEEEESKFDRAVVVADFKECSKIGRDILKEGGNAADAAIAAMLCVGIYNCHSVGIGGGLTALFYDRTKHHAYVVYAREKSSWKAKSGMFKDVKKDFTNGTRFIATPGEVKGYIDLHRYGKLPWKRLFEPAIELARNGFEVHSALANAMKNKKTKQYICDDPGLRSIFVKPSEKIVGKGDIIRMPKLADTLQTIADDPDSFYKGDLATKIAQELNKGTGYDIDTTDLNQYSTGGNTDPLLVDFYSSNLKMYTARPPANGAIAAYMLNIMDEFGLDNDILENQSKKNLFYHRYVEASKFACANMHGLGDEDKDTNIKQEVERLISKTTAKEVKAKISDSITSKDTSFYSKEGMDVCRMIDSKEISSTSHVSVIDQDGNAVAMTSSINSHFGAKFLGPDTGIIYNNHMADFIYGSLDKTLTDGEKQSKNLIEESKRPQSSLSPMIFVESSTDDVVLVTGGAGASTITPATLQVAMNYRWLGKTVRNSVQKKRLFYDSSSSFGNSADGLVIYEQGYDSKVISRHSGKCLAHLFIETNQKLEATISLVMPKMILRQTISNVIDFLKSRNHRTHERINGDGEKKLGVIQLAANDGRDVWGYSDKRKKGAKAAGYR